MLGTDKATWIQHDSYYVDRGDLAPSDRASVNYDHPDALETPLLVKHVRQLVAGEPVEVPVYDFTNHVRTNETTVTEPRSVILLDGIFILADDNLRDLMDIKVFVDTDPDLRLLRRLQRDMATRQRDLESVVRQYTQTVRPMHMEFVEPSMRYADVIIPEGGHNDEAIDTVHSTIESMLTNLEPETPLG